MLQNSDFGIWEYPDLRQDKSHNCIEQMHDPDQRKAGNISQLLAN
jgi:hypothetical protein